MCVPKLGSKEKTGSSSLSFHNIRFAKKMSSFSETAGMIFFDLESTAKDKKTNMRSNKGPVNQNDSALRRIRYRNCNAPVINLQMQTVFDPTD